MLALTTAITNAISKERPHKDANMSFATSSHGEDVDPETYICVTRVLMQVASNTFDIWDITQVKG